MEPGHKELMIPHLRNGLHQNNMRPPSSNVLRVQVQNVFNQNMMGPGGSNAQTGFQVNNAFHQSMMGSGGINAQIGLQVNNVVPQNVKIPDSINTPIGLQVQNVLSQNVKAPGISIALIGLQVQNVLPQNMRGPSTSNALRRLEVQKVNMDIAASGKVQSKRICSLCQKEFSKFSNLLRHQRSCHSLDNQPIVVIKKYACGICPKSYETKFSLERHKKKIHSINIKPLPEKKCTFVGKHRCDICEKVFSSNSILKIHKEKVHGIEMQLKSCKLKCSDCKINFASKPSFMDHLIKAHGFSVQSQKREFESWENFDCWKIDFEKDTASKYIFQNRYTNKSGLQSTLYVCRRNGKFKSSGCGKRRMKIGGSVKIEYFCPASITVQVDEKETNFPLKVKFLPFHLGHKCEAGKLPLSKPEKNQIAGQLLSGMPLQNVLVGLSENASSISKEQEKNVISEGLKKDKKKTNHQQDTKDILLEFMSKLDKFSSEEQCKEIQKTIAMLTSKCEALENTKQKSLPPIGISLPPNKKKITQQRTFPKRKVRNKRKMSINKLSNNELEVLHKD